MTRCCKNCRFSVPSDDLNSLMCQRYPPQVVKVEADSPATCCFPEVHEDDWCGEFRYSLPKPS